MTNDKEILELLEEKDKICSLYDIYKDLLTDKQKEYFECYYFDDMTLAEISNIKNVSRNAIFLALKSTKENLLKFDSILKLNENNNKINDLINYCIDNNIDKVVIDKLNDLIK